MLTKNITQLLAEADAMNRRLQLLANGATIHRANNLRHVIMGAALSLLDADAIGDKAGATRARRALKAGLALAEAFVGDARAR
jgi:uncharacterized membrane protein